MSLEFRQAKDLQHFFQRKVSFGQISQVRTSTRKIDQSIPMQTVSAIVHKYQKYGTLSRRPGSRRPFKLTSGILAIVEKRMRKDNETTAAATQLLKLHKFFPVVSDKVVSLVSRIFSIFKARLTSQILEVSIKTSISLNIEKAHSKPKTVDTCSTNS